MDLRYYAENTEGFSGADLDNFCKEVALRALTEKGFSVEEINLEDFQAVFETFRASVKSWNIWTKNGVSLEHTNYTNLPKSTQSTNDFK